MFSISSERRRFRMEDVIRPFGVLENVLGVLLDGFGRVNDGRMVRAVFIVLAG